MSDSHKRIAIIGAPLDLGQGRRGVDMGPSAVRVAGLGRRLAALGYNVADLGNVPVSQAESVPDPGASNAKYLAQTNHRTQKETRMESTNLIRERAGAVQAVLLLHGGREPQLAGEPVGVDQRVHDRQADAVVHARADEQLAQGFRVRPVAGMQIRPFPGITLRQSPGLWAHVEKRNPSAVSREARDTAAVEQPPLELSMTAEI